MDARSVRLNITASMRGVIEEFQNGARAANQFSTTLGKELKPALAAIAVGAAAGVGLAVSKFADFDQAMSNVQASTHETADVMGQYRQAALDAGSSTVFSATESANAIDELAKAGLSANDILGGGLTGSLDLAAAGGLGVARAAEIASTTLQQFGLEGSKASHVADVLAAGAGKAMGSVDDLANGLKFVGPVAASLGVSLEQTTGVLALFAQQGIIGEQAGTSLRGVLASLTSPSKESAKEIERLGLNLYDAQGNFLGLENAAGELSKAYGTMDQESRQASLGIIFGRETITAATALYQAGAEGVAEWSAAVDDSGYAAETARLKLDNLKGDVEALGGALDTALIQTGSSANGTLRDLVQGATGLVTAYAEAPGPVQALGLALGVAAAAAAAAGLGFVTLVPKIAATRAAMQQANISGGVLAKGIGKGGALLLGLTALTGGFAGLGAQGQLTADQIADVNKALKSVDFENVNKLFPKSGIGFDVQEGQSFQTNDALASLKKLTGGFNDQVDMKFTKFLDGVTFGLTDLSAVFKENEATFNQIGTTFSDLAGTDYGTASSKFADMVEEMGGGADTVERLLEVMPDYKATLTDLATAAGVTVSDQELLNLAIGKGDLATQLAKGSANEQEKALTELGGAAESAEGDITELADAITNFGKAQFDTNAATREFEAAIDDAAKALETNGQTMDVTTEAGRANQAALDDIASSALGVSAAIISQTNDQDAASAALQRGRDAYIEASVAAGVSEEAANAYADQLGLIPSNVSTAIVATGVTKTQADIDAIQANLAQTIRELTISIRTAVDRSQLDSLLTGIRNARSELSDLNGAASGSGRMGTYASGGPVYGAGTGTSDSIVARLSNGEHVLTAREVLAAGGHQAVMAWRKSLVATAPGFAGGGPVFTQQAPRYVSTGAAPLVMVAPAPVSIDAPIYADSSLLGFVRGVAGQEIQFALATEEQVRAQGWRPV